jgi:CPA2 family monovalent cation:H+ antiporter-2
MHYLGWIHSEDIIEHCAEYGLVFLLFTLGLEFSIPRLIDLKKTVFGLGSLQMLAVSLSMFAILFYWGLPFVSAVVCAIGLSFSSTAILIKELKRREKLNSDTGEKVVAILLFQDLLAMAVLLVLPCLPYGEGNLVIRSLLFAFAKGTLLFCILMAIGQWVLPKVLNEIVATKAEELFVLVTLVISLAAAWLTDQLGLSMALGSFLIGMMMGESHHAHRIEKEIRPFRDLLLGVFFVSIGMKVDVNLIFSDGWMILFIAFFMIFIKTVMMFLVLKFKGHSTTKALELSLYLSQGGEFGFAVLSLATTYQLITIDVAPRYLSVIVLSMALSPLVFTLLRKLNPRTEMLPDEMETEVLPIPVVVGYEKDDFK